MYAISTELEETYFKGNRSVIGTELYCSYWYIDQYKYHKQWSNEMQMDKLESGQKGRGEREREREREREANSELKVIEKKGSCWRERERVSY